MNGNIQSAESVEIKIIYELNFVGNQIFVIFGHRMKSQIEKRIIKNN
jgi:hypothetical protein